jgi:hypothetical protein
MIARLAALWCRLTHAAPLWPIHGSYICPTCLRTYPCQWEDARLPGPTSRVSGGAAVRAAAPISLEGK